MNEHDYIKQFATVTCSGCNKTFRVDTTETNYCKTKILNIDEIYKDNDDHDWQPHPSKEQRREWRKMK